MKASAFTDATRIPFEIEVPVAREKAFKPLLGSQEPLVELLAQCTITKRKKDLFVEHEKLVRPIKVRGGRKAVVAELPLEDTTVPVLFYTKQDQWFAAPAGYISGNTEAGQLEILDVDFDGHFDGELDYLAWRGGRLHMQGGAPQVFSEDGIHEFSLEQVKSKLLVQLSPATYPQGVPANVTKAWLATNELRNGVGLEPVQLDLARTDAAAKHAHYLQTNGPGGSGTINVHDEKADLPGYTPEGKQASMGNVSWGSGGNNLPRQPHHEFATLFHRSEFVYPSLTMGAGSEGGYGVVWVEDGQSDLARWLQQTGMESNWVMTPGPGQKNVPQRALRDSPVPASVPDFYSRDRGFPVSVSSSYTYGQLENVSLRLFTEKGEELEGFLITMADAGFTSQGFSADYLFAAKQQLDSKSTYRAEFRARLKSSGRELSFDWSFSTGK
ncbi:MAG: hypothetical protein GY747_08645 [Planctomycetes bacterium]|nr:hypothetical protein [Planctomycetota bacterium]